MDNRAQYWIERAADAGLMLTVFNGSLMAFSPVTEEARISADQFRAAINADPTGKEALMRHLSPVEREIG